MPLVTGQALEYQTICNYKQSNSDNVIKNCYSHLCGATLLSDPL